MNADTSRRTLLRAALLLPVAAVPAANPDAELIATKPSVRAADPGNADELLAAGTIVGLGSWKPCLKTGPCPCDNPCQWVAGPPLRATPRELVT
jgi:hypothetical protein